MLKKEYVPRMIHITFSYVYRNLISLHDNESPNALFFFVILIIPGLGTNASHLEFNNITLLTRNLFPKQELEHRYKMNDILHHYIR